MIFVIICTEVFQLYYMNPMNVVYAIYRILKVIYKECSVTITDDSEIGD